MLNGAKRNEASQVHTASRDSKAYGTLRERFAQNDILYLLRLLKHPLIQHLNSVQSLITRNHAYKHP